MFKKINNWYLKWAGTRNATLMLLLAAFADASFFTMPVLTFFSILTLSNISKARTYILIATGGTVAGAIAGYFIGHYAFINHHDEFTRLAQFTFNHIPGFSADYYEELRGMYEKWDIGIVFIAVLTPVPYKYFAISAGIFDLPLISFIIATTLSQAIRFIVLTVLFRYYGEKIKIMVTRNLKPITISLTITIIMVILLLRII